MLSSRLYKLIENHTIVEWMPPKTIDFMSIGQDVRNVVLEEQRVELTLVTPFIEVGQECRQWMQSGRLEDVGCYKNLFPTDIRLESMGRSDSYKIIITFESIISQPELKETQYFPPELFEI